MGGEGGGKEFANLLQCLLSWAGKKRPVRSAKGGREGRKRAPDGQVMSTKRGKWDIFTSSPSLFRGSGYVLVRRGRDLLRGWYFC